MSNRDRYKETGIPCWKCHNRSGTDCGGRKPDESTLCSPCFSVHLLEMQLEQAKHVLKLLDDGEIDIDVWWEINDVDLGW